MCPARIPKNSEVQRLIIRYRQIAAVGADTQLVSLWWSAVGFVCTAAFASMQTL